MPEEKKVLTDENTTGLKGEELVNYLVKTIQDVRPDYDRNFIINIMVCITQGFLTVFSGPPGCGKTSICGIISDALGLGDRFVPVSVERGWVTKADFIGYYNGISGNYVKSNKKLYDCLMKVSEEEIQKKYNYPCFILLDEANLSPMEYYWAQFMNVCDSNSKEIDLGGEFEDSTIFIPETLHFLATINNDHTTEILSPRLIDRSWVITLPQVKNSIYNTQLQKIETKEKITWNSLKSTFNPDLSKIVIDEEIKNKFINLKEYLERKGIGISPRSENAVWNYYKVASQLMEDRKKRGKVVISSQNCALDYAISQRVLPSFSGSGEEYREVLLDIREYAEKEIKMPFSVKIIDRMISVGDRQMNYYQFFN